MGAGNLVKNIIKLSFAFILIVISSFIIGNSSLAYRPFGTEDAGVAGRGVAQFEASWDNLKWSDGKTENVFLFVPIYGVTDRLEFSCEVPSMFHNFQDGTAHRGFGDANLVAKYLLLEENSSLPASTFKSVVKLNSGNSDIGLGSGDRDLSLFAVFSKSFSPVVMHMHLGYSWVGKAKNPNQRDIALYGLAFDCGLTSRINLVAELNGNKHPDITSVEDPRNWLVGLIIKSSDKLLLDLGVRGGLTPASPDFSLTIGASITI